jgi:hypothetical protein
MKRGLSKIRTTQHCHQPWPPMTTQHCHQPWPPIYQWCGKLGVSIFISLSSEFYVTKRPVTKSNESDTDLSWRTWEGTISIKNS